MAMAMAARGEIVDRIAASVGNRVITASDLDRQLRVAAFQDGVKPDFSPARKRAAVEAMIEQQMDGANAEILRQVGVKAVTFAYPCGQKFIGRGEAAQSYVPLVARRFLVGRGFRDEAANDPLFCDLSQVYGVESDGMSFDQMKAAVVAASQQGSWLVFAGHEIGVSGPQTTLVSSLEQFLKYAQDPANGVWLGTVEKVATYIRAQRGDK